MTQRGEVYWLNLGPRTSRQPAGRRPVVVVQSQRFLDSALPTTVVACLTSNLNAANYPGNVFVPASAAGLSKDSVIKATELFTVDGDDLGPRASRLPSYLVTELDQGLRLVLSL